MHHRSGNARQSGLARVLCVTLGIVLAAGLGACTQTSSPMLVSVSPYASDAGFASLEPMRQVWVGRMDETVRLARAGGFIPYGEQDSSGWTFGAFYGSGFLVQNQFGNDLDTTANIHLGKVAVDASSPAGLRSAADEILRRVEGCLGCFQQATTPTSQPGGKAGGGDFVFSRWHFARDQDGRMARHDEVRDRLAALLADIAAGRQHVFVPGSGHRRAGSHGPSARAGLHRRVHRCRDVHQQA